MNAREQAIEAAGGNKVYDTWWLDEALTTAAEAASDVWEPIVYEARAIISSLLHFPPAALTPHQQMVYEDRLHKAMDFMREQQ